MQLSKTVLAWTVLSDGVPMIYQGQEQGFSGNGVPANREAMWTSGFKTDSEQYVFIKLLNAIRHHIITLNRDYLTCQSHIIYSGRGVIAYTKGHEGRQVVTVLSSGGTHTGDYNLRLATAFTAGTFVTDVVRCANYTVNGYGQLDLPMLGGLPHVLVPSDVMNGSRLCGFGDVSLRTLRSGAALMRGTFSALIALVFCSFAVVWW